MKCHSSSPPTALQLITKFLGPVLSEYPLSRLSNLLDLLNRPSLAYRDEIDILLGLARALRRCVRYAFSHLSPGYSRI